MGSFDYTCAISRLPISSGTAVRLMLLTENPYTDENKAHKGCQMHAWWVPRTFPLKAEYNDYGSVQNIEEGPGTQNWLDGFQQDLVERGWGDNSVHDVPTSKVMGFQELLDAIQEGRVTVLRDTSRSSVSERVVEAVGGVPVGVPTMARVTEATSKVAGQFTGWGSDGFLVDELCYGTVRVRWHGSGSSKHVEHLSLVRDILDSEYATVLMAGDGPYADSAELRVHARPGTKDFHGGIKDDETPLGVSWMMIREDVWQALLKLPTYWAGSKKALTITDFRKSARTIYSSALERSLENHRQVLESVSSPEEVDRLLVSLEFIGGFDESSPVGWLIGRSIVPFSVGLAEHWRLLVKKGLPLSEVSGFLDSVAELAWVGCVLAHVRWMWVPSSSSGEQFGDPKKHVKFLEAMVKVAKRRPSKAR